MCDQLGVICCIPTSYFRQSAEIPKDLFCIAWKECNRMLSRASVPLQSGENHVPHSMNGIRLKDALTPSSSPPLSLIGMWKQLAQKYGGTETYLVMDIKFPTVSHIMLGGWLGIALYLIYQQQVNASDLVIYTWPHLRNNFHIFS